MSALECEYKQRCARVRSYANSAVQHFFKHISMDEGSVCWHKPVYGVANNEHVHSCADFSVGFVTTASRQRLCRGIFPL